MSDDDWGQCHFCGSYVKDGVDNEGQRHWLSDCRPDLVEHEIGPTCTWWGLRNYGPHENQPDCYAYQDPHTNEWTDKHAHFYNDGTT